MISDERATLAEAMAGWLSPEEYLEWASPEKQVKLAGLIAGAQVHTPDEAEKRVIAAEARARAEAEQRAAAAEAELAWLREEIRKVRDSQMQKE